ncbi:MAG: hypothetical protein JWN04_3528 [Myxococcaceae bacterium]|nr:hypothetical protein [Myxococcaceae bacterium]
MVAGSLDAGTAVAIDHGQSDGGARDGGVGDAAVDSGVPLDRDAGLRDGGLQACSIDSPAKTAGSCYGVYCATTPEQLQHNLSVAGQCRDAAELALACDGELTRVVSSCAQDDVLMLGLGGTVAECARAEPSLQEASDGCIDCYVSELLCAVQSCLTPCLAGLSPSCTECRSMHCGKAFQTCTGLPAP